MPLLEILGKTTMVGIYCTYFVHAILGFIIEGLALAIYLRGPSLAKVLRRTS